MNEATIERVAKHLAASNGDPSAWGAYAHQAMQVIELAEDQWEPMETSPRDGLAVILWREHLAGYSPHEMRGAHWDADQSRWFWKYGRYSEKEDNITHWRPMPRDIKPPKT